jgi:hypothetical protein
MAEEVKKEGQKCGCDGKKAISSVFKVLLGLVFLGLAAYLLIGRCWWYQTWLLIKGSAGPFLVLAGIITLAIAKE